MSKSEIHYTVLVQSGNGWAPRGQTGEMATAIRAAEKLVTDRRVGRVKVDKTYREKNRVVTTTIMEKGSKSSVSVNIMILLALAGIGGVISFGVTFLFFQG